MAIIAQTFTITTTDASYIMNLTGQYQLLNVTNLDAANAVWINFQTSAAAAAEADENIIIRPGESIVIRKILTFRAIAITASVKLTVWGTDNI